MIRNSNMFQSVRHYLHLYQMASSWALETSKVQATIFFVKVVILWSDQLPRFALQREPGMLAFLYALEVKEKKNTLYIGVYSSYPPAKVAP